MIERAEKPREHKYPNIPVIESLEPTEGYGIAVEYKKNISTRVRPSNAEMHFSYLAISKYIEQGKKSVRIRLNGPGSGKTTILSQDLALKRHILLNERIHPAELPRILCHVSFESVQRAAEYLEIVGPYDIPINTTQEAYEWRKTIYNNIYNPGFNKSVLLALTRYPLVEVEAPFFAWRGVLEDLLPVVPSDTDVYLSYYSPSTSLLLHTIAIRGYSVGKKNRRKIISFSGTEVIGGSETSSIPGGDRILIDRYYWDELRYAQEQSTDKDFDWFQPPTSDPTNKQNMIQRADYLKKYHSDLFYRLKIPKNRVSMHEVPWIGNRSVMYVNHLEEHDFVNRLEEKELFLLFT